MQILYAAFGYHELNEIRTPSKGLVLKTEEEKKWGFAVALTCFGTLLTQSMIGRHFGLRQPRVSSIRGWFLEDLVERYAKRLYKLNALHLDRNADVFHAAIASRINAGQSAEEALRAPHRLVGFLDGHRIDIPNPSSRTLYNSRYEGRTMNRCINAQAVFGPDGLAVQVSLPACGDQYDRTLQSLLASSGVSDLLSDTGLFLLGDPIYPHEVRSG